MSASNVSPTATSDLQESCWGVFSPRSNINFHQTLRPFEETLPMFEQTKARAQSRMSMKEAKQAQSITSRPHQQTQQQRRRSPTRQLEELPQEPVTFPRRHQHISNRLELSLGPSRPVPNHRSRTTRGVKQPSRGIKHSVRPAKIGINYIQPRTLQIQALHRHPSDDSNRSRNEEFLNMARGRRREIISRVNQSVQSVLSSMLSDDFNNMQWKFKFQKKDVSCYVDETSINPGQLRFCCVSHTHATVDEVMELFLSTDSDIMLRNNRLLYDNLLETRVLSVLRRPTEDRPMNSIYVRHSCFQTPGPFMNQQMCAVVATDMIHQPDGSTIGYCLWDSIDDQEFIEAAMRPGLEVCKMFRSGFFIRRSGRKKFVNDNPKEGLTKIVYMIGMGPRGCTSGLATRFLMEKHGSSLERLCSHLRRKHLDSNTFVMKTQWISKCSTKSCQHCDKSFQVLSNRVNCHACGQVVCTSCSSKEEVELHAVGLVPMRICFSCLEKAGLPSTTPQKTLRRRRLHSDNTSMYRTTWTRIQTNSRYNESQVLPQRSFSWTPT